MRPPTATRAGTRGSSTARQGCSFLSFSSWRLRRPLGALDPCGPPSLILFYTRLRTHTPRPTHTHTRARVEDFPFCTPLEPWNDTSPPQPLPGPPSTRAPAQPAGSSPRVRPQHSGLARRASTQGSTAGWNWDAGCGRAACATPSCCMLHVACSPAQPRFLTPADGAHGHQSSWFGRMVVGQSC